MINEARTFNLAELGQLTEMPRRTIRYYIQEGLVDRPEGAGRGTQYTGRHLEQLLEIRKWQRAGLSLERIRELIQQGGPEAAVPPKPRGAGTLEVWSHLVIDDGIELTIEPSRAGLTPEQIRELAEGAGALFRQIRSNRE